MRVKLRRFKENKSATNILEPEKPLYESIKGKWLSDYFNNNHPITLELACGRGEYTIGLARKFPDQNFIGVDIKGDRLWRGSQAAIEEGLDNVGFLRTHILELGKFFDKNEVNEIWITFPDPRPKDRDEKRRLTHSRFLDIYKSILKPGGWLRLKTDNTQFYEFTLNLLQNRGDIKDLDFTDDLYQSYLIAEHYDIRTRYEKKFGNEGHNIKYLKCRFVHR